MTPSGPTSPYLPPYPPSPKARERRAARTGLAVSAVLHLFLIALYPSLTGVAAGRFRLSDANPDTRTEQGIKLIDLEEVVQPDPPVLVEPAPFPEEPPPEPEAEPEVENVADVPATEVSPPGAQEEEEEEEAEGLTIAERLQPRFGDARVWLPVPEGYRTLSQSERAELIVLGMLQSWNDSVAIAAALSEQAQDWTYTDSQGRRWGLGPGRLYLGDFSIPLPAMDFVSQGLIEDRLGADWTAADLARGAATAAIRETWTERARAIRERMEVERDRPPARAEASDGG